MSEIETEREPECKRRDEWFQNIREDYEDKKEFLSQKHEWEIEKEDLEGQIKNLEAESADLSTTIEKFKTVYDEEKLKKLTEKRLQLDQGKLEKVQSVMYAKCLKNILEKMKGTYLMSRLKFESTGNKSEVNTTDQKKYSVYGLILHACHLKELHNEMHLPNEPSVDKVLRNEELDLSDSDKVYIEKTVKKALLLSYSMLTVLPPLLVCSATSTTCEGTCEDESHLYLDALFEKNRLTWLDDQIKVSDYKGSLYKYRPAVVYGNQLHIAVKGLVGNSLTRIPTDDMSDSANNTPRTQKRPPPTTEPVEGTQESGDKKPKTDECSKPENKPDDTQPEIGCGGKK